MSGLPLSPGAANFQISTTSNLSLNTNNTGTNDVISPQRKRGRCDSGPHDARPPEKMSKNYDEIDTDTEMEGLVCSTSSSPSISHSPILEPSSSKINLRRPTQIVASEPRKRDEKYYLEDGSCVLLVGDTLFNVSRWPDMYF